MPKSAPPAGQHWYYQTDRASKKKCWYLASKDGVKKAEKPNAAAAAEPEPADEPVASPTPTPSVAEIPTKTEQAKPEPQQQSTWITRNASETGSNGAWTTQQAERPAPLLAAPEQSTTRAEAPLSAPDPQPQPASNTATVAPAEAQPAQPPLVLADVAAAAPEAEGHGTLQLILLALASIGILAGAAFVFMEARRRRGDVLNRLPYADMSLAQLEQAYARDDTDPAPARRDRPTYAPLPPISAPRPRDDVDEALERFSRARRRRAA